MNIRLHRFEIPLEHEFTIARSSRKNQQSLIVELEHEGVRGYGESTANAYYGVTLDSMAKSIESCQSMIQETAIPNAETLWESTSRMLPHDPFSVSAIDQAAHDLVGKLAGRHTFDMLGLDWKNIPDSSYTIGIASIDQMIAKMGERSDWRIYKIKLGTGHDVEIIRQMREKTNAIFRVDANCSWTVQEAISNSHVLKDLGVEFIEQPLPADADDSDHRRVFAKSALPIIADENCLYEPDVQDCHGRFHGINVKLCKCGGLTPAVRMLHNARSLGLKTMIGCMIESTVGISAAAQLLPLLNYADLDGAELLRSDIATGVTVHNGKIQLPERFGNGVSLSGNP